MTEQIRETDIDRIVWLEKELDRAYRALGGYANAHDKGEQLSNATRAYHAATVGAAKRWMKEDAMDGADYFIGKPIDVLHKALAL